MFHLSTSHPCWVYCSYRCLTSSPACLTYLPSLIISPVYGEEFIEGNSHVLYVKSYVMSCSLVAIVFQCFLLPPYSCPDPTHTYTQLASLDLLCLFICWICLFVCSDCLPAADCMPARLLCKATFHHICSASGVRFSESHSNIHMVQSLQKNNKTKNLKTWL